MAKRYYWLKLKEDFFDSKRIKKLRRVAGGDTFTIIYLKMQLKAMKQDGMLHYDGLEATPAEELALDLDEDVENVQFTLTYLLSCGLAETSDNTAFFLPYSVENTGSEGASAQRMRDLRAKQSPPEISQVSHCDISVTERKRERKSKSKREEIDTLTASDKPAQGKVFNPPSVDDVAAYCQERNNGIDPGQFVDHYTSNGWMVGKNKMKDWKAAVRTWERYRAERPAPRTPAVSSNPFLDILHEEEARQHEQSGYGQDPFGT